uniref:Uncharacterized protein n=1 Tax=Parascaris equorum TaxID=6256 RepID=A0A914R7Y5_PAREQ
MDRLEDAYDHVDESFEPFNKQVPSHSPCRSLNILSFLKFACRFSEEIRRV